MFMYTCMCLCVLRCACCVSPVVGEVVVALQKELAAFSAFYVTLGASTVDVFTDAWYVKRGDAEAMMTCAEGTMRTVGDSWAADLQRYASAVKDTSPPDSVVTDPSILTDKKTQALVLENVNKDALCKHVVLLGVSMQHVRDAHKGGFFPAVVKEAYKAASERKRRGKMAIGMDYVIGEVVLNQKTIPDEIRYQAKSLLATLQQKKCEMPKFILDLLHQMKNVQAPSQPSGQGVATVWGDQ